VWIVAASNREMMRNMMIALGHEAGKPESTDLRNGASLAAISGNGGEYDTVRDGLHRRAVFLGLIEHLGVVRDHRRDGTKSRSGGKNLAPAAEG
jgi:hypothetical protein